MLLMVWLSPPTRILATKASSPAVPLLSCSPNTLIPSLGFSECSDLLTPCPILFLVHYLYHSFACRTDPNSGTCGDTVISVCVSEALLKHDGVYLTHHRPVPQRWQLGRMNFSQVPYDTQHHYVHVLVIMVYANVIFSIHSRHSWSDNGDDVQ